MQRQTCRKIKSQFLVWRIGALPGMVIVGLIIIARVAGLMQSLEWLAFDNFLRKRSSESIDEKILIVEINEKDIRSVGKYPIPDKQIAALIRKLQSYNPRVIGLDIYRDLPVEPGNTELKKTFQDVKNLIAIEKVLPEKINPPPGLSSEQVCFADQVTDSDGKLRRTLLATPTPEGYKLSLSICLAQAYLAAMDIGLENGIRDENAMRFGDTEIPRFISNSGGYVRADDGGVQVLLNYRSSKNPFRVVSFNQIQSGKFKPEWVRDKIIIIGVTAPSVKDFITTAAIKSSEPSQGRVYGVKIQAHAVSQIISGVLEGRPFINTWSDSWEYLWILGWGILGIAFARLSKSPLKNFTAIGVASSALIITCYLLLLIWGWWIPLVPSLLVFTLNGVGLTALYQYDEALRSRIKSRQTLIERTFETIHNGPLQTLAKALKLVRDKKEVQPQYLISELENELEQLNKELRGIYEFLQQEPISQDRSLYLGNSLIIDLKDPLHEILYQIYSYTLERDFPYFQDLRIKIRTFEPIDDKQLSIEQKRGICRFLEEALINVGKHAIGLTRLEVACKKNEGWYILSIVDDGLGINSSTVGRGTQQFRNIAHQLKGRFRRSSVFPRGTLCELRWTATKFGIWN